SADSEDLLRTSAARSGNWVFATPWTAKWMTRKSASGSDLSAASVALAPSSSWVPPMIPAMLITSWRLPGTSGNRTASTSKKSGAEVALAFVLMVVVETTLGG